MVSRTHRRPLRCQHRYNHHNDVLSGCMYINIRNNVIGPLTWLAIARTLVSGTKDCCSQSSDEDDIGSGDDVKDARIREYDR